MLEKFLSFSFSRKKFNDFNFQNNVSVLEWDAYIGRGNPQNNTQFCGKQTKNNAPNNVASNISIIRMTSKRSTTGSQFN